MSKVTVTTTKNREVIDITDTITSALAGSKDGIVNVFVAHTTAAVTVMDLDPGTDLDFLDALAGLLPDVDWRHPHDPAHTPDHILASIIGPDSTIPLMDDKLALGTWQRVVLVELDGPRDRTVYITTV